MPTTGEILVFLSFAAAAFASLVGVRRFAATPETANNQLDWLDELEISSLNENTVASEEHDPIDLWLHRIVNQSGTGLTLETFLLLNSLVAFTAGWIAFEFAREITSSIAIGAFAFALGVTMMLVLFSRRRRKFLEQFPVAIDLIAGSVEAGHSLTNAMQTASESNEDPVQSELLRCVKQMSLGMSPSRSIQRLSRRIPAMDVKLFAHTISVHEEMGGRLGGTLRRMAEVIRQRSDDAQKVRSATSLGRFAVLMICSMGLLALAYLIFFHPDYIGKLFESPLGQKLVIYAVISEVIGIGFVLLTLQSEA